MFLSNFDIDFKKKNVWFCDFVILCESFPKHQKQVSLSTRKKNTNKIEFSLISEFLKLIKPALHIKKIVLIFHFLYSTCQLQLLSIFSAFDLEKRGKLPFWFFSTAKTLLKKTDRKKRFFSKVPQSECSSFVWAIYSENKVSFSWIELSFRFASILDHCRIRILVDPLKIMIPFIVKIVQTNSRYFWSWLEFLYLNFCIFL